MEIQMTCIISGVTSKGELKRLAAQGAAAIANIGIEDPSIFNPRWFTMGEMTVGQRVVVTNHPKRSWFAQIERTATGWKIS
jgi:hypothetical protein